MVSRAILLFAVIVAVDGLASARWKRQDGYSKEETNGSYPIPSKVCEGECVQYYLCSSNNVEKEGAGYIDIRVGEDPEEEEECPHFLQICCETDSVLSEVVSNGTPTRTTTIRTTTTPRPTTPHVPLNNDERGEDDISSGHHNPTCGIRNPDGLGFRINGNTDGEAEYGEFPWMLAVLLQVRYNNRNIIRKVGGASLIAPHIGLTVAHFVHATKKNQLIIRAGEWDTETENELDPHQDRRVAEIIAHEDYDNVTLANDVALIFLTEPFVLAESVQPVCLPPKGTSFDHSECFVSGWGKDVLHGVYKNILKKGLHTVVPYRSCQQVLRSTRLKKWFGLHPSFMCAESVADINICTGDGGSPLVCPIAGSRGPRYYQAGIVSWGIGCGKGLPGVFVNVAYFREWIDQQILHTIAKYYVYEP